MEEELITNFSLIKEKYYDLQTGNLSVSEFKEVLLPFLTNILRDRNYKKLLGDRTTISLNSLLINIQDKFNAYEDQKDIGNDQDERKEQKGVLAVATKIVSKLEDVIDKMEKKDGNSNNSGKNLDPITTNEIGKKINDYDPLSDSKLTEKERPPRLQKPSLQSIRISGKVINEIVKYLVDSFNYLSLDKRNFSEIETDLQLLGIDPVRISSIINELKQMEDSEYRMRRLFLRLNEIKNDNTSFLLNFLEFKIKDEKIQKDIFNILYSIS